MSAWIVLTGVIIQVCLLTFVSFKILRKLFTPEELEKFKEVTGIYVMVSAPSLTGRNADKPHV